MAKASRSGGLSGDEAIVVLHGAEAFLQTEVLANLRAILADRHDGEVEVQRFDGRHAELAEVLDALRTFGLMQQYRLVVVEDADPFVTKHRESLERYAAEPVDIGTLVLRPGTWNGAWKLSKAIAKVGAVIKCEPMDANEAQSWATRRARDYHQVKLSAQAAALLIEHLGVDLGLLDTELGKLSVGAAGGQISVEQVETMVGRASDEMAWEIQDAMLSGDASAYLGKLHELVDLSHQAEQLVAYFVIDLVRKLHHAQVMLAAGSKPFAICQQLKIWPKDRQGPFLAVAKRLGRAKLADFLGVLVDLDRRSKSGFGKNLTGLERFGIQFAGALS